MTVYFHEEDLPADVLANGPVAIDTETMGLITPRDRLCVVQISDGQGDEHLVRFSPGSTYDAPNLKAVIADPSRLKLFHFGRFDIAALDHYLGVLAAPVYCTKIASRLVRTYTDRHGLKELVRELLGQEISKQHDRLVKLLKSGLPVIVGLLAAFLVIAPFTTDSEVSFVLDKNEVDVASERMRVREALYRGEDSEGRPFSLRAGSAVQKTSREPVVEMNDLSARMLMSEGPAVLTAQQGRYNMESEQVKVDGPVQFASEGYRLTTSDVNVALKDRTMKSDGRVYGRMPIGTFDADHLNANLGERTVTLQGNARLRIEQNALKGREQ